MRVKTRAARLSKVARFFFFEFFSQNVVAKTSSAGHFLSISFLFFAKYIPSSTMTLELTPFIVPFPQEISHEDLVDVDPNLSDRDRLTLALQDRSNGISRFAVGEKYHIGHRRLKRFGIF